MSVTFPNETLNYTRDQQRMVRHKTRLLNQLKITLKEYYPRPVEVLAIWSRV
jgi:hypothetical protein